MHSQHRRSPRHRRSTPSSTIAYTTCSAPWRALSPSLSSYPQHPSSQSSRCRNFTDNRHRKVINGVLYRVRTGVQWRDLPERFRPWETVYKRHRRWSADGTWTTLLSRIQAAEDAAGRIDWDVSVDSTAVRAHQHAAGARKAPAAGLPQKGAGQGTNQADPVLRKLAARLEEVVRSASAWDGPAEDSPPKSTSSPRDDAGPSPSS
ncbi:transposase [Streptomyces albireticuli]|uniref:transposase n=1 Tax=Streptomyces albireticuli TaxID=1940 RepID=UPI0036C378AD